MKVTYAPFDSVENVQLQTVQGPNHALDIYDKKKRLLRRELPFVITQEDDALDPYSYHDLLQAQRGGSIGVLIDKTTRKVGLVEQYRPSIDPMHLDTYRRTWDQYVENSVAFAHHVCYLIGAESLEFPGGYSEKGETSEMTAIREAEEESGLKVHHSEYLGHTSPNPNRIDPDSLYLCWTDGTPAAPERRSDLPESGNRRIFWVDESEFCTFARHRRIMSGPTQSAYLFLKIAGYWH